MGNRDSVIYSMGSRIHGILFDNGGCLAWTRKFRVIPDHHEQWAERIIASVQIVMALVFVIFIGTVGGFAQEISTLAILFSAGALFFFSSLARLWLAKNSDMPDALYDSLSFADVAALYFLILTGVSIGGPGAIPKNADSVAPIK